MTDETEAARRHMIETAQPYIDAGMALANNEQTWTTDELTRDFEVIGFMAPFVVARKRGTNIKGSLEFTHSPRLYFNWKPDKA